MAASSRMMTEKSQGMIITSQSNERIKNIKGLRESTAKRRRESLYIVEGEKMFLEAPPGEIAEIYVSESFAARRGEMLKGRSGVTVTSDAVFKKISGTVTPQGILCVMRQKKYDLSEILAAEGTKRFLVLERVSDPGNVGTMIRTAECADVTAVIADGETADRFNPKVIRSTMGSIFRMPYVVTDDLNESVRSLKKAGVRVYGAHLAGERTYDSIDYPSLSAIMIGNESAGLSDDISKEADELVRIPMAGKAESLNAAVAAAILMYASVR